jgi:hypothetical protein
MFPVLKMTSDGYRPLVIKLPDISLGPDFFTRTMLCDELSSMLAIIGDIPDGIRLGDFPSHWDGPDCWCRPQVAFVAGTLIVTHKDLGNGEFDC